MKPIEEILEGILSSILLIVAVESNTAIVNNEFTIQSSNTQWLTKNRVFSVAGNEYKVLSFTQNVEVVLQVRGHAVELDADFELEAPKFFSGTWIMTSEERDDIKLFSDKLPFAWMIEVMRERIHLDEEDPIVKTSPVRLIFLAESQFQDWLTIDHKTQVIYPLQVLVDAFIEACRVYKCIARLKDEATQIRHANAGKVDQDGHNPSLFNEELSGIELIINLPLLNCNC